MPEFSSGIPEQEANNPLLMATAIPDTSHAKAVKAKVDALLEGNGWTHARLYRHMGMSSSTYGDMWNNGYVTVNRLIGLAEGLGVPAADLLPDEHRGQVLVKRPDGRPYVEDRLEALEREFRSLRNELKNKVKKR